MIPKMAGRVGTAIIRIMTSKLSKKILKSVLIVVIKEKL
jgi:hypothetical protein